MNLDREISSNETPTTRTDEEPAVNAPRSPNPARERTSRRVSWIGIYVLRICC